MSKLQAPLRWTAALTLVALLGAALAACGGGGGSSALVSAPPTVINYTPITVNGGPPGVNAINTPYITVTMCVPGTNTCQTIDSVLVDTGSIGFRVLAGALGNGLTSPQLPQVTDSSGDAVVECVQFIDGYSWGPVKAADIKIAGETASNVDIQVIGDPAYPAATLAPAACTSSVNVEEDTVLTFGANAVLGVGNYLQDCNPCLSDGSSYNVCTSSTPTTCQPVAVSAGLVTNPVASFASDNNGVVIQLPTVSTAGAASVSGTLWFGIGTQSNNGLGSATVYQLDPDYGTFVSTFDGQTLTMSFEDSGSNANFFPDPAITACPQSDPFFGFYCPASTVDTSATIQGYAGNSVTVPFTVTDPDSTLSYTAAAAPDLGGPESKVAAQSFDWGLPFFFDRTVFIGFETATIGGVTGPLIAF
jgi:hypothetical protein